MMSVSVSASWNSSLSDSFDFTAVAYLAESSRRPIRHIYAKTSPSSIRGDVAETVQEDKTPIGSHSRPRCLLSFVRSM